MTGAAPVSPVERAALARARELATRGRGRVSPNPLVGAVVLRDGEAVAEGWHEGPGLPHAEAMALERAGGRARGATVVCTLEPCSHHGRTPPCADALIRAGVARVVVGLPDPLERGRAGGRDVLRAAGVEVAVADAQERAACAELNSAFLTAATLGRPEVLLKLATSLDGRIATATGESRWISGPDSRALVHRWRADVDAVAVGVGTALADDPLLTARDVEGPVRQPARVVFDSLARLPLDSALVRDAGEGPVVVLAGEDAPAERLDALARAGVDVVTSPGGPRERVAAGLRALAERNVQSVLVEGGARLAGGLLEAGAVDRVAWFLAPMLIGGDGAPAALAGPGAPTLAAAPRLAGVVSGRVGADVLVTGRLTPLPGLDRTGEG
ncbi:bifunctional diaminohydroxyphosphoribosylaminopyrimidine deaminase/5-amino-6-(5-phosphoribosylamino)uracil reductase RibD [Miltoncostaea marina]|uniref:bifunctional diaminohydroxyphosphoribosylaminopyrimidine deaminase/5-amino-6-(5-phosphoribosylamino)uracil reductase RibD n=1 Tax=Miltoncostaea marina TaxID=2843215 RepID=UPI001C3C1DA3|nr:bifunctional diaminohydroxyphosphoribosylaminopyrimidine deaminase/5-amino-6-(5-phosphoribosylamino)uracil reductase RibD [Miltoncostaea marina]